MILRLVVATCLVSLGHAQTYTVNDDPQLARYIEQALERNPAVRESFARYRASVHRIPQMSSLPDPMLGLTQYLRSPETRVGPQTTMLTFSQKIPWFGKLGDQEKVAATEARVSMQQHESRKLDIVHQVKSTYYTLAYIDRALEITRGDLSVLQHYEGLAQARYAQGVGLQQAVIKLQAELTRVRNRQQELHIMRVDAEAALNLLLDLPAVSPVTPVSLTSRGRVDVDFEQLYQTARDQRPEVKAALLKIERDEKRIHLARKSHWPDFTVGAGLVNVLGRSDLAGQLNPPEQNGKNIYSLTLGVNIPIRRRKYDAAVMEATESKIAAREGYRDAVNRIEASIRAIGFRVQTLQQQIGLFERTLLPQAEQALESSEAAYGSGTAGVLDLLDSERTLLDVRLGLARLTSDYMKSLSDMERAIGAPF